MALDLRRGRSARERLEVEWHYPVWKPAAPTGPLGSTVAVEREHALPLEEALQLATDGDRRPLLVMRECLLCKGTDHALLSRTLDNEQTALLSHWFRCVKLPPNVLDAAHPFTNLWQRQKPGDRIPHLFFCDPDGQNRQELPGDQAQSELWATMFGYLERCYDGNPKLALKALRGLLGEFDRLDAAEDSLMARLDDELDANGSRSSKAAKYRAQLDKLAKERKDLVAKEAKIRGLALAELNAPAK